MAVGWARDDAVHDQIHATVDSAVQLAKSRIPAGDSRTHCEGCQAPIPEERRQAIPGVRHCVACQQALEKGAAPAGLAVEPPGRIGTPPR